MSKYFIGMCVCVCVCTKRNLFASGAKVINAKSRHFWPKKSPEGERVKIGIPQDLIYNKSPGAAAAAAGGASNENCVSSGQLQQTPVVPCSYCRPRKNNEYFFPALTRRHSREGSLSTVDRFVRQSAAAGSARALASPPERLKLFPFFS